MNNPISTIRTLMSCGNPKQFIMNYIKNNDANPMLNNIINMAERGDREGLEKFARNLFKEQGRNYDEEFNKFVNQFGLKK